MRGSSEHLQLSFGRFGGAKVTNSLFHRNGNSGVLYAAMAPRLQRIADKAGDMGYQFQIITSWRSDAMQLIAFKTGKSKAKPGQSPHNHTDAKGQPFALAFDFLPHPFVGIAGGDPWKNIPAFRNGAHIFSAAAALLHDDIVWGADWNDNGSEADEHGLRDFDHIELKDWRSIP